MNADRRHLVEELFERLADEPRTDQRRLLTEACGNDAELFTEVAALLDGDALRPPVLRLDAATLASNLLDGAATVVAGRVGRYVIQRYLGDGGMGSVYVATREDVGGLVALKFLRETWSSPAGRRRFLREQATLAGLSHRYIARLYDAGVTNGQDWFAMEYVEGVSIVEHCRSRSLELRERLGLFRNICEAVSYAHRKLVVHLDLKPSNVLVSGEGEVKLLDFGIARSLTQEGNASATGTAHALLSLSYASPEQILGDSLDVQTDVFALGVLLYELLVGAPPIRPDTVRGGLAAIVDHEPRRPSLSAREHPGPAVHASRAQWKDLDAICLKAASRDKATRYTSVERLANDVEHFLKDEPIDALTRHFRYYRTRKFVHRHRLAIAATATIALTVGAIALFYNVRLIEARNLAVSSEARMQRINQVMVNLFEGDDSTAGPSEGLRVVSLLDRGAQEAEALNGERELQAELRSTFGGLYHKLGHLDRAEPLLLSSLMQQRQLYGSDDPRTLKPQLALVMLRLDQSKIDEAKQLADEALTLARRRYAAGSPEVATAEAALGKVFSSQGKYTDALPLLEGAVKTLAAGNTSEELSDALGDLGNTLYYTGQVDAAEAVNRRALDLDRRLYGGRHPSVAVDLFNLGNIALDHADYPASERLFREALAINDAWYGPDHPRTASNVMMLGRAAAYVGHTSDAAALYERALKSMQIAYGERHVRVAAVVSLMGDLALTRRQWQDAEMLLERARTLFRETVGEEHEFYQHMLSSLGAVQAGRGRYDRAVSLLRPAVEGLVKVVPDSRYAGVGHVRLAAALAGLDHYADAEREAQLGIEILRKVTGPSSFELSEANAVLEEIRRQTASPTGR